MTNRNGKVILAKNIKLEKSYKNVLDYTDTQMLELVVANKVYEANDFSFINRDERNYVQIDISYTDAIKANYLAYQNPDYSGKWFFAFIDRVEYYSESSTRIRFTIDEFSTWYGYWGAANCFVEREHVNDDTVGLHTVPEGLETGDYIINNSGLVSNLLDKSQRLIIVSVTKVPNNTDFLNDNRFYCSIYSGTILVAFLYEIQVSRFLEIYAKMGISDAIQNIYLVSSGVVTIPQGQWQTKEYEGIEVTFALLPNSAAPKVIADNLTYTNVTSLNGYIPKNGKLKTFPYTYLSIANNNGVEIPFKYEDFTNNTPTFQIIGSENAGCQTMMIPKNYKLYTNSDTHDVFYNYGINGGKWPTCSWTTDLYTNWLTQNGVNIMGLKIDAPTSQAIGGSIEAVLGAASIEQINPKTGDVGVSSQGATGIGSGLGKMFGAVQENYRHSLQSPTLDGQIASADVCFGHGNIGFTYYKMSIKAEYARIIDEWFTRFGYKVNRLKTPNITGRTYWNFVKIGAGEDIGFANNQYFDIPAPSMEIINTIFRNGVTIWHNHANIGNFTLNNTIVTP